MDNRLFHKKEQSHHTTPLIVDEISIDLENQNPIEVSGIYYGNEDLI